MRHQQRQVHQFHLAAGAAAPCSLTVPDEATASLRLTLIREEAQELAAAFKAQNIVEIADAIGDLLYVTLGTAVSCGIDIHKVFEEIHRSNMTKFIDGHRREDGKWVKGPSYTPADIAGHLVSFTPDHDRCDRCNRFMPNPDYRLLCEICNG